MKLDNVEVQIINELLKNSRKSMRELAKKVDVTTPTVSKKIKKLEDIGIIKNHTVNLDYRKLGFQEYIFRIEAHPSNVVNIIENLKIFEFVKDILELDGKIVQLSIEVPDLKKLDSFLNILKDTEEIKDYKFERVTEIYIDDRDVPIKSTHNLDLGCYYCHKPIEGDPVKLKMDGKEHYLCCETCAKQYKEKYEKLKSEAD